MLKNILNKKIIFLFSFIALIVISLFGVLASRYIKPSKKIIRLGENTIYTQVLRTNREMERGLSYVEHIEDNEGYLFCFPYKIIPTFWMKGMLFDLDMMWIADNKIIGFEKNVPALKNVADKDLPLYSPPSPIDCVLEMKSGSVDKMEIKIGDEASVI